MYCANCGKQLPDSAAFCNNCGMKTNTSPFEPHRKDEKKKEEVFDDPKYSGDSSLTNAVKLEDGASSPNQLQAILAKNKKLIVGAVVFLLAVGGGMMLSKYISSPKEVASSPATTIKSSAANGVSKTGSVSQDVAQKNSFTNNSGVDAQSIPAGAIVAAYHSSADQEGSYIHSAKLAIDGNIASCWSEGVKGLGIGENIEIHFNGNYKVSGMNIWIGHQKSQALFYQNARPTALRVVGSDDSSDIYRLQDVFGPQRITFTKPIIANKVKLIVERVVPGNKYEDTCIAEVNFF